MPQATVALTAQYLNVRQRKLGTIIPIILQHESAVTDSLPEEEFVHGQQENNDENYFLKSFQETRGQFY
jgi:hypothetical protein